MVCGLLRLKNICFAMHRKFELIFANNKNAIMIDGIFFNQTKQTYEEINISS